MIHEYFVFGFLILENIEYDCLKQRYPLYLDDLNEIVELLVETVCAKRKTTRISGEDFPHEIVRSRFLKLDSSHIDFVMDCLQKNTTQVRNIKQYLLAVLFNAPTTMNNHFTSLVIQVERITLLQTVILDILQNQFPIIFYLCDRHRIPSFPFRRYCRRCFPEGDGIGI